MRISIDPSDRAYDEAKAFKVAKVTFDGEVVKHAITADEELGEVVSFKVGEDGGFITVGDRIMTEHRSGGRVVVELKQDDRAWDKEKRQESKVAVGLHPDGAIELLVYSAVRPGAIKRAIMPRAILPLDHAAICQAVGVQAGALAEMLCDAFSDTLDPEDVARVATEQTRRALADNRPA